MDKLTEAKAFTSDTIKALQLIAKLVDGLADSPEEEHTYLLMLRDASKMHTGISNRWKRHMDQLFMEMTDRVLRSSDAAPNPKRGAERLAREFGGLAETVEAILNQANDSVHRLQGKTRLTIYAYYINGHTQQWIAAVNDLTQARVSQIISRATEHLKKLAERTTKKGG